jgi:hypothetical protein
MKLWQIYNKQPEPLKQIILPIAYLKILIREGVLIENPNKKDDFILINPHRIPRINLEIWMDSYTFFKPFTKKGKYHAPLP